MSDLEQSATVLSILSKSAVPMSTLALAKAASMLTGRPLVSFLDAIKWHAEIRYVRVYRFGTIPHELVVSEAGERPGTIYPIDHRIT